MRTLIVALLVLSIFLAVSSMPVAKEQPKKDAKLPTLLIPTSKDKQQQGNQNGKGKDNGKDQSKEQPPALPTTQPETEPESKPEPGADSEPEAPEEPEKPEKPEEGPGAEPEEPDEPESKPEQGVETEQEELGSTETSQEPGEESESDSQENQEENPEEKPDLNEESKENTKKGPKSDKEIEEEEDDEENPDLFEGDLKLSEERIKELLDSSISKRDAVTATTRQWPNAKVPYIIASSFDQSRRATLDTAIKEFNKKTCVRFVPKQGSDQNYVVFIRGKGCYSTEVGKNKKATRQVISIGDRCNYIGTVIHEMMHAIGFFHEQSRRDRDDFIDIIWGNIKSGRERQFWKYAHGEADYLGAAYDYKSVMHYGRTAFGQRAPDGSKMVTIVPKNPPYARIGQRTGFSDIDVQQINKLYKCNKRS